MHSSLWNEVMVMDVCIAEMSSYTYAVKGERLLRARGYPCKVKRKDTPKGGCGFVLYIYGCCPEAADILDNNGVPYRIVSDGGA